MGLDITKGSLKPASKPKSKPKPAQRSPPSLSPATPSSSSLLVTGTPHSPAATAPATLGSPQTLKPRTKQTARRAGFRMFGRAAPPRFEEEGDSLEAGGVHEGSLGAAQGSAAVHGAHGESARGREDESVGESPRIVVDATASDSSGSGGSDGELEAHLNGPDSPWFRQHASVMAVPVAQGGRRFEKPSATSSRSSAAAVPRRDPFASAQDYIPLEHQQRSVATAGGPGVDVGMEDMTPEPQLSQGQGISSPMSKLQSPGPSVVDRYGRRAASRKQGQAFGQDVGVEEREREVIGEDGVVGSSSPDVAPSYKRGIGEVVGDEEGESEGRRKRAETVDEDELDDYNDRTLSFLGDSQDGGSASPDPRDRASLSQPSRTLGSRSTTLIETFLRSDTPFHDDEAFERDESPMTASEDGRGRRQSTPFPFSKGDGNNDRGNGGQRSPSFSPAPAEDPSSSSLEQAQPAPEQPRRTRTVLPPSLAEHYGAEVTHPHYHHATLLAASASASEQEREGEPLSWEDEKEGFVRRFKAVTDQVGELFDQQAAHFSTIAHELEQHGERLDATARKLGETKDRVREWGKPMFEAARGGSDAQGPAAAAGEGEGGGSSGEAVEEGKDGVEVAVTDENGEV
ncbi:hypothetical protein JCM8208_006893 [Rhodotorula glutinis]